MDKVPRIPSKTEGHALVRSRGEDEKLTSRKQVLGKVHRTDDRYLRAHRVRFVEDRRRSMENVYNPASTALALGPGSDDEENEEEEEEEDDDQPEIQHSTKPPPPARRSRRRQSDPEVIGIFRNQEDRRRGMKAAQDAVLKDEELARLNRKKLESRPSRDAAVAAVVGAAPEPLTYGSGSDADREDDSTLSSDRHDDGGGGGGDSGCREDVVVVPGIRITGTDNGVADRSTEKSYSAHTAGGSADGNPDTDEGGGQSKNPAPSRKTKAAAKAQGVRYEAKKKEEKIGKTRKEDIGAERGENPEQDKRGEDGKGRRAVAIGNVGREDDIGKPQRKSPADYRKENQPGNRQSVQTGKDFRKEQVKETKVDTGNRQNDRPARTKNKTTNHPPDTRTRKHDTPAQNLLKLPDESEHQDDAEQNGEPKQRLRRKRSYSDGNIFFNIYEVVQDKDLQPYLVAKSTPAADAGEASSASFGKQWSEDVVQQPRRRVAYGGWGGDGDEQDYGESATVPREETYIVENSNNNNDKNQTQSPSPTRRFGNDVTFQLPDADETLSPRLTRKRGDVGFRAVPSLHLPASPPPPSSSSSSSSSSASSSDAKVQPQLQQQKQQRRQGVATPADIKLSPSLKKRLATGGGAGGPSDNTVTSPRRGAPEVIVMYSPSLTRRLATGVPSPSSVAKQRGADPTAGSPKPFRRFDAPLTEAETANRKPLPRQPRRHEAAAGESVAETPRPRKPRYGAEKEEEELELETSRSSPKLARREVAQKPSPRPKPIYQQTDPRKKPNAGNSTNRRPLRRSRSEVFIDQTVFIIPRDRPDFPDIATPRRGSNPFVAGGGALTSRMSTGEEDFGKRWDSLAYGLALNQQEREDISRHKRMQLVNSLRKRQEEVDNDVSRRIRTFLNRYDDA